MVTKITFSNAESLQLLTWHLWPFQATESSLPGVALPCKHGEALAVVNGE